MQEHRDKLLQIFNLARPVSSMLAIQSVSISCRSTPAQHSRLTLQKHQIYSAEPDKKFNQLINSSIFTTDKQLGQLSKSQAESESCGESCHWID